MQSSLMLSIMVEVLPASTSATMKLLATAFYHNLGHVTQVQWPSI
jgi:hypothetical protein